MKAQSFSHFLSWIAAHHTRHLISNLLILPSVTAMDPRKNFTPSHRLYAAPKDIYGPTFQIKAALKNREILSTQRYLMMTRQTPSGNESSNVKEELTESKRSTTNPQSPLSEWIQYWFSWQHCELLHSPSSEPKQQKSIRVYGARITHQRRRKTRLQLGVFFGRLWPLSPGQLEHQVCRRDLYRNHMYVS